MKTRKSFSCYTQFKEKTHTKHLIAILGNQGQAERRASHNKFYALRARPLRWVASSGLRGIRSQTTRTPGGVFGRAAASRYDHILTCCEDTASQNVSVKSTLCERLLQVIISDERNFL